MTSRDRHPSCRPQRRCPRTWPHAAHGPWRTGETVQASDVAAVVFDCPGVPVATR